MIRCRNPRAEGVGLTLKMLSFRLTLGLLTTILLCQAAQLKALTCQKDASSPCKCKLSDGATGTIDFSPLFSSGKMTTTGGDYSYELNACSTVSDCSGCTGNCLVCQLTNGGSNVYGIGSDSDVTFDISRSDPTNNLWRVVVSYEGGADGRHSEVQYDHSTTTSFNFLEEKPDLFYHMQVTGPFIVPSGGSGGPGADIAGIPGIVLIVLFIAVVVAYIVIGIAVNAGVRHKRGVEMIPNLEFWKDFPSLLKDGVIFTFTYPCNAIKNRSVKYDNV